VTVNLYPAAISPCSPRLGCPLKLSRTEPGYTWIVPYCHYGCRRIIQVDAAHWWWLRRFPLLCKALWVQRKVLYKCNELLITMALSGTHLSLMSFAIHRDQHRLKSSECKQPWASEDKVVLDRKFQAQFIVRQQLNESLGWRRPTIRNLCIKFG